MTPIRPELCIVAQEYSTKTLRDEVHATPSDLDWRREFLLCVLRDLMPIIYNADHRQDLVTAELCTAALWEGRQ